MAVGRIKYPALAKLLYPCPGFMMFPFYPFHQYSDIIGQFIMNIGFVPCGKFLNLLHYRVLLVYNFGRESIRSMGLKLPPDQFDKFFGLIKTKTCTMNR